jgi:peptidoglycan-N-acetylglucosamine deacetylase
VSILLAAVALTALGTQIPEHRYVWTTPNALPGHRADAAALPDPSPERRPTTAATGAVPDPNAAGVPGSTAAAGVPGSTAAGGDNPPGATTLGGTTAGNATPGSTTLGGAVAAPTTAGGNAATGGSTADGGETAGGTRIGDSTRSPSGGAPRSTNPKRPGDPPPTVALTFDDGPSPYTPKILDILRRQHVPATFCMVGDEARRFPAYAQMVVRDGHQLCNHSQNHADMTQLNAARARHEVATGEREIRDAAGAAPRLFRFPYGASDRTARTAVDDYGLHALFWDVDPQDWTRPPASTITSRILAQVRPGSVVLMHDGGGDRSHTVASLDATIAGLRKRGYRFVLADVVEKGE